MEMFAAKSGSFGGIMAAPAVGSKAAPAFTNPFIANLDAGDALLAKGKEAVSKALGDIEAFQTILKTALKDLKQITVTADNAVKNAKNPTPTQPPITFKTEKEKEFARIESCVLAVLTSYVQDYYIENNYEGSSSPKYLKLVTDCLDPFQTISEKLSTFVPLSQQLLQQVRARGFTSIPLQDMCAQEIQVATRSGELQTKIARLSQELVQVANAIDKWVVELGYVFYQMAVVEDKHRYMWSFHRYLVQAVEKHHPPQQPAAAATGAPAAAVPAASTASAGAKPAASAASSSASSSASSTSSASKKQKEAKKSGS
jgi:hypothetical protein